MGSGGGNIDGGGRGGGRVIIYSDLMDLPVGAAVSADGSDSHVAAAGGGSGGSISIYSQVIQGKGIVQASGGMGFLDSGTGGGSGGRIFIQVSILLSLDDNFIIPLCAL